MTECRMVDVQSNAAGLVDGLAELAFDAFRVNAPTWLPTLASARAEVVESLEAGRLSRALVDTSGHPRGWIGVIPHNQGRVWEIHPIAVRPTMARATVGAWWVKSNGWPPAKASSPCLQAPATRRTPRRWPESTSFATPPLPSPTSVQLVHIRTSSGSGWDSKWSGCCQMLKAGADPGFILRNRWYKAAETRRTPNQPLPLTTAQRAGRRS